jgi:hypothetical protein
VADQRPEHPIWNPRLGDLAVPAPRPPAQPTLELSQAGQFLIAAGMPGLTCDRCGKPFTDTNQPFLLYALADRLWHWQCVAEPTLDAADTDAADGEPSRRWWPPTRLPALLAGWFGAGLAGCV